MRFNNDVVFLTRPATVAVVSEALGLKPFEVMVPLISLAIFPAPLDAISDEDLRRLGQIIGVDFRFDDDGGTSMMRIRNDRHE